jgi:integrase
MALRTGPLAGGPMASFRKLPSGKWQALIARQGVRESKSFPTRAAARDWAARREYLLQNPEVVAAELTFGALLLRYANEVSDTKRGAWWEIIRIRKLCRDELAGVSLAKLSSQDFARWRDRRLREVAPASVQREMQLMSSAINVARREWGLLQTNPLTDVRRPRKPPPRDRRPTADELERMTHAAGSDLTTVTARAFHAFLFGIETAMRAGEIVGLRRANVDRVRRVARLTQTKNGRPRDVPLSRAALDLLAALPDADPVFGLDSRQLDALFRKIRKRAAVEGLTFHDSRHEAITRLAKKLDVLALARMVGHSDLRMLQVYYNETAEELAKRLD